MIKFNVKRSVALETQLKRLALKKLKVGSVLVGVMNKKHLQAAWTNQIGSSSVPGVEFLTRGIFTNKANYQQILVSHYHKVNKGSMSISTLLSIIGVKAVEDVQQYMRALKSPGNAEATIAKKGFDNRLISKENGLLKSITYKVSK